MNTRSLQRVVLYTDATGVGGAEISLGHLVKHISVNASIAVVGVSRTVVDTIADQHLGVSRIVLPASERWSFFSHCQTFHQLQPDIIHCNLCTPWACATGLMAALLLPHARVVRVDQLPLRTTDALTLWRTRALSLRVDAHVAVGEASARRMEDFYALGRDSVISIPNGVPDVADLPAAPLLPAGGQMVVGAIGRLDAMKGFDILIWAIAQVEGVQVYILGDGGERQDLEALTNELGVSQRVHFFGWVDHPRAYLSQFDVVAMPSRSEGFPLVMVEAMLAARPVIATRVGSMPEAIVDGKTGILIEKNDVAGLAQALKQLRDDPHQRDVLGQQARARAITELTADRMAVSYQQLWQELLNRPPVPRWRVPRPKD